MDNFSYIINRGSSLRMSKEEVIVNEKFKNILFKPLIIAADVCSTQRSDLRQADTAGNLPVHISSEHGFGHMTWSMLCVLGVSVLRQTNKAGYTPVDLVLQNDKPG